LIILTARSGEIDIIVGLDAALMITSSSLSA